MIGFGIVIPVLPLYARSPQFHLSPGQVGTLVGIFSLIQFFTSPIFGKLSDRVGRKPVLIVSIVGTAVGFAILGAAQSAWMLFLGRIIDGVSGGNIAAAQSCVADVTPPEGRSRAMGMIGAAFGLGFIMGPALGGILGQISHSLPFYFASALSLVNLGFVLWQLPETLTPEMRLHPKAKAPMGEVFAGGRGAFISLLVVASFVSTTGFAFIHVLFAPYCVDHFGWSQKQIGYAFAYVGILAVFVQGGLLRQLLVYNIEKELALTGAVLLAISLWLLPRCDTRGAFLADCALLALGNGLLTPTLSGLSSRHVHGRAQGRVLGLMAGAGSLGRYLGPTIAMLPIPAAFSDLVENPQPHALDLVNHGYLVAFTWSAGLVVIAAACLVALRVPRDIPEEATVLADAPV